MNFEISNTEPIYPISTAAKLLDISIPTLRMYENEGLIIPAKSKGNQRLYSKRDIERLKCIRRAIRESKISINGIKSLYSLIPCWEITGCSDSDRKNCSAYNGHEGPCWASKHPHTQCEFADCIDCNVYQNFYACNKIKEVIQSILRNKQ